MWELNWGRVDLPQFHEYKYRMINIENHPQFDLTEIAEIQIYTLIDIRDRVDPEHWEESKLAHQNWNILVQTLGMISQPTLILPPVAMKQEMAKHQFGKKYKGKHLVWATVFACDRSSTEGLMDQLKEALHGVPVSTKLRETVKLNNNVWDSKVDPNIYFAVSTIKVGG